VKQHIKKLWEKWWFWLAVGLIIFSVMFSLTACGKIKDQPAATVVATHVVTQATPAPSPSTSAQPTVQASTPAPTKVAKKYNIFRGPNTTKRVVLTFDDCPKSVKKFKTAVTYAVKHDIGLVLFPIGGKQCVAKLKAHGFDLVAFARKQGIWVGNHSLSHRNLPFLSASAIKKEISGAVVANYGRPPYGGFAKEKVSKNGKTKYVTRVSTRMQKVYASVTSHGRSGMRVWIWTVDTLDWTGKSREQIAQWAIDHARAGGTVLMHMNHSGFNPWTMQHIVDGLASKHLRVCGIWRGEDRTGDPEATTAFFPDNIC